MNKVTLIGNLTQDPTLRTLESGVAVCSFSLAVNRRKKVEGQPDADFFNITAWRGLGENCAKYLSKGRKCAVCGSIQMRRYKTANGEERTAVDIIADDVEFLSPAEPNSGYSAPPYVGQGMPAGFTQVDEDDLPF